MTLRLSALFALLILLPYLLARGKRTEALAAADEALAMVPTRTDTIVGLVQMLDTLGLKADADALFRRGWEPYIVAVRAHPKSASLKHSAAWLARPPALKTRPTNTWPSSKATASKTP